MALNTAAWLIDNFRGDARNDSRKTRVGILILLTLVVNSYFLK